MPIKLNTGVAYVPATPPRRDINIPEGYAGEVVYTNDTTPSERVIYPVVDRPLLLVEPGQMTVVTAYDLHPSDYVVFHKILRSNGVPSYGTPSCCPVIFIARSVRLRSVRMDCWRISADCPVFVLRTPGAYDIEIVGGRSAEAMITATSFPMQDINKLQG